MIIGFARKAKDLCAHAYIHSTLDTYRYMCSTSTEWLVFSFSKQLGIDQVRGFKCSIKPVTQYKSEIENYATPFLVTLVTFEEGD